MVEPLSRVASPADREFATDVLAGLSRAAKELPCKYFYDERGSHLFDRITELPEYYLTRTEPAILERHAAEMAGLLGPGCLLIEYGSGSGTKTRLLLEELTDPAAYVPIDVSPGRSPRRPRRRATSGRGSRCCRSAPTSRAASWCRSRGAARRGG